MRQAGTTLNGARNTAGASWRSADADKLLSALAAVRLPGSKQTL